MDVYIFNSYVVIGGVGELGMLFIVGVVVNVIFVLMGECV